MNGSLCLRSVVIVFLGVLFVFTLFAPGAHAQTLVGTVTVGSNPPYVAFDSNTN